ncbi:MAG: hypothetical protein M0P01_08700 [Treponema sp.]|nr:hypothetical protein [Treponema sp.]
MSLFKISDLESRGSQQRLRDSYSGIYSSESSRIAEAMENFSQFDSNTVYDIFLSHSYTDKRVILGLLRVLTEDFLYSVYVDWINDQELDRTSVNKDTAEQLKYRMQCCKCLFYVTTENASSSKWMPWETGLMDGLKHRVAICPLVSDSTDFYYGQEYLGIYPYVSEAIPEGETDKKLWINESSDTYTTFDGWLQGYNPTKHGSV